MWIDTVNLKIKFGIVFVLLCLFCACGKEDKLPEKENNTSTTQSILKTNTTQNILKGMNEYISEETKLIEFNSEANNSKYLLRGWRTPEKTHTWAVGKKSLVSFLSYDIKCDKVIEIICYSIIPKNKEKQVTNIYLNGNKLDTITIATSYETYKISAPAKFFNSGQNILEFRYSYTSIPKEIGIGKDTQALAVSFKKILISGCKSFEKHNSGELVQKANSVFSFIEKLPAKFVLFVDYKINKNCKSYFQIIKNKIIVKEIVLPSNQTILKKQINLLDKELYDIKLVTKGPEDSSMIWKDIKIDYYKNNIKKNPKKGVVKISKPDILVYVIDALRADHLGCYGYSRNTSPNIDRFAKENVFYQNAYATSSWTRASGASILTGLTPNHHKTMKRDESLPEELITLPEILRDNGYYTVGFYTNGNISNIFHFDQGFDRYIFLNEDNTLFSFHKLSDKVNKKVFKFLDDYLKQDARKPLFLFIWTTDPHGPYTPPDKTKDMFNIGQYDSINTYDFDLLKSIQDAKVKLTESQREFLETRYDQEIYFNDFNFGRLLDKMKEHNIYKNSVVFLTADHGEEFYEHGSFEHGKTVYEESIKVPLLLKYNDIIEKRNEPVQITDIFPTITEITGISYPFYFDGKSLIGDLPLSRTLYLTIDLDDNDVTGYIYEGKKIIYNRHYRRPPLNAPLPLFEYYNIVEDKSEKENEFEKLSIYQQQSLKQKLFSYINQKNNAEIRRKTVEIPEELDRKLKQLGYVK